MRGGAAEGLGTRLKNETGLWFCVEEDLSHSSVESMKGSMLNDAEACVAVKHRNIWKGGRVWEFGVKV